MVVDACELVAEEVTVWVGGDPVTAPEKDVAVVLPRPNASLR